MNDNLKNIIDEIFRIENINEIDFTDMIWLPYVLHLKPIGLLYDYILGDECQDFSTAQRELLLRCRKINTRMFFFGDKLFQK